MPSLSCVLPVPGSPQRSWHISRLHHLASPLLQDFSFSHSSLSGEHSTSRQPKMSGCRPTVSRAELSPRSTDSNGMSDQPNFKAADHLVGTQRSVLSTCLRGSETFLRASRRLIATLQSCCVMGGRKQMPDEEAELGGGIPVFQSTRESAFYPKSPKPSAPYISGRLTW